MPKCFMPGCPIYAEDILCRRHGPLLTEDERLTLIALLTKMKLLAEPIANKIRDEAPTYWKYGPRSGQQLIISQHYPTASQYRFLERLARDYEGMGGKYHGGTPHPHASVEITTWRGWAIELTSDGLFDTMPIERRAELEIMHANDKIYQITAKGRRAMEIYRMTLTMSWVSLSQELREEFAELEAGD